MLGMIMPVGRTMMYLPNSNTHSGPWTEYNTKVCIAITIVSLIVTLLSTLIEATFHMRSNSFKESITGIMRDPFDASMITCMSIGSSLLLLTIWIVVGLISVVLSFM